MSRDMDYILEQLCGLESCSTATVFQAGEKVLTFANFQAGG